MNVKGRWQQPMKSRIKLALTILVVLLGVGSLSRFLDWMNLPSDLWFWSGLAALLLLLVVTPTLVAMIWRPQRLKPGRH
jgi:hypothetical protein